METEPQNTDAMSAVGEADIRPPKSLLRAVGRAIADFDMIRDGDRVLLGLSGGKDSMTLLWVLAERRKRVLVKIIGEVRPVRPKLCQSA